jgi:palmitoyl-protein thioesterase
MEDQIENACFILKQTTVNIVPDQTRVSLLGFSLGGLVARGIVQKCDLKFKVNSDKIDNLVTIGTPHMGIDTIPPAEQPMSKQILNWLSKFLLQYGSIHKLFGPSNVLNYKELQSSQIEDNFFIPDINNLIIFNLQYKQRISKLNKFVMIGFSQENYISPSESVFFGFFSNKAPYPLLKLEDLPIFKEDRLGLQELASNNRLKKITVSGQHQNRDLIYTEDLLRIIYEIEN